MLRNEFVRVVTGNSSSALATSNQNQNQHQHQSSTMAPNPKYSNSTNAAPVPYPYQHDQAPPPLPPHTHSGSHTLSGHGHHNSNLSGYNAHNHSNSHSHHNHLNLNHNHQNHNHSGYGPGSAGGHSHSYSSATLNLPLGKDLTPEELQLLAEIRQRKEELRIEIEQLQSEIDCVSKEIGRVPLAEHEDSVSIHSNDSKDTKLMSLGCKKFNMDPKKGIEFLTGHGLLDKDHESIAQFLYRGEGLSKTAIGDYLGEKNEFNENVLRSFVALHDFTDLILVQALRQFLWSFRLPGEAQKIDRMMECFAQRYCILNPDIFTNTDTCYVLSFAIIMLNTSLHNPSVKEKPSVEQFITMNRGINNGEDLPRELLISLYNSIQAEPFKIPEDDGNDLMHTFFNPDKEGWLWKQGGRYKSWKRRWFILNDNCLYYFEFTTDKEPRGIIPLENVDIRTVQERKNTFEMYTAPGELIKACKTDSGGRVVEGKHAVYRMSASSEEERDAWVQVLKSSISRSPFYELLSNRKKAAQQLHNMIRK